MHAGIAVQQVIRLAPLRNEVYVFPLVNDDGEDDGAHEEME